MKNCTYCGEEIQDKAKKCRYCGEWFDKNNLKEKKNINNNEKKSKNHIKEEKVIDLENEINNSDKQYTTKTRLIWGIILTLSLIIIFIIAAITNWIGYIIESSLFIDIISYIIGLLYFISIIFLTPFGIYLLVSNKNNKKSENINDIEYIGFWERVGAHFIDIFLAYLIIPLFFNLYYWFKNGQTIGYKIIGIKTFSIDGNKIKSASGLQLFFYPFLKILNFLTLYIGFIMIGFTKKKQGLHNIISNTVVVRIEKKNNKWILIIVGIFGTITVLSILGTIAFISLQGYSEEARKVDTIEGNNTCIDTFGKNAYYTGEKENEQYLCFCNDGYEFGGINDVECVIKLKEKKIEINTDNRSSFIKKQDLGIISKVNDIWEDNETKLMWQIIPTYLNNWNEANAFANESLLGNYNDWRLPTSEEIKSIYLFENGYKCTQKYLDILNYKYAGYWTSSNTSIDFYGYDGKMYFSRNSYGECLFPGYEMNNGGGVRLVRGYVIKN